MNFRDYENEKKNLKNLTPREYEKRIKEILERIEVDEHRRYV